VLTASAARNGIVSASWNAAGLTCSSSTSNSNTNTVSFTFQEYATTKWGGMSTFAIVTTKFD
jgi:hypothetical protein